MSSSNTLVVAAVCLLCVASAVALSDSENVEAGHRRLAARKAALQVEDGISAEIRERARANEINPYFYQVLRYLYARLSCRDDTTDKVDKTIAVAQFCFGSGLCHAYSGTKEEVEAFRAKFDTQLGSNTKIKYTDRRGVEKTATVKATDAPIIQCFDEEKLPEGDIFKSTQYFVLNMAYKANREKFWSDSRAGGIEVNQKREATFLTQAASLKQYIEDITKIYTNPEERAKYLKVDYDGTAGKDKKVPAYKRTKSVGSYDESSGHAKLFLDRALKYRMLCHSDEANYQTLRATERDRVRLVADAQLCLVGRHCHINSKGEVYRAVFSTFISTDTLLNMGLSKIISVISFFSGVAAKFLDFLALPGKVGNDSGPGSHTLNTGVDSDGNPTSVKLAKAGGDDPWFKQGAAGTSAVGGFTAWGLSQAKALKDSISDPDKKATYDAVVSSMSYCSAQQTILKKRHDRQMSSSLNLIHFKHKMLKKVNAKKDKDQDKVKLDNLDDLLKETETGDLKPDKPTLKRANSSPTLKSTKQTNPSTLKRSQSMKTGTQKTTTPKKK